MNHTRFTSLSARLSAITDALPEGSSVTLSSDILRGWLSESALEGAGAPLPDPFVEMSPSTREQKGWQSQLWNVPADTRLQVADLAEALGRPKSYIYARTSQKKCAKDGLAMIPHRKLDGCLTFVAGEIRAYILDNEELIHVGPLDKAA